MKLKTEVKGILGLVVVFLALGIAGCSGGNDNISSDNNFDTFLSQEELEQYLENVASKMESESSGVSDDAEIADAEATSSPASESRLTFSLGSGEIETNNQSENVDEGDIIKFMGDRLVILRDQHLLIFDIADRDHPTLISDRELDADFGEGTWGKGAWYDEMLIFDSAIVLIAYRFNARIVDDRDVEEWTGAIEILKFNVLEGGELDNGERIFIESSDYYSGTTNYASRKIDTQLLIYSPFYARSWISPEFRAKIPYVLELVNPEEKRFRRVAPAISYDRIYRGLSDYSGMNLHVIYSFDVSGSIDIFKAMAVVGDYSRNYYVTRNNFYLSLLKPWFADHSETDQESLLYQFVVGGDDFLLKNAAVIKGSVPERFAMHEKDDELRVITQGNCSYLEGSGWMGSLYATKLNVSDLATTLVENYGMDNCGLSSVRFNGDFAVISPYTNYYDASGTVELRLADFSRREIVVTNTGVEIPVVMLLQPYNENKWVALGRYMDSDSDHVNFSLDFNILEASHGGELERKSSFVMKDEFLFSEAFWNDHSFFFDPIEDLFGVPYARWIEDEYKWQYGVQYFSINGDELTEVNDRIVQTGEACYECWYGNSRVVKRNGRYYNLLGRQLKVTSYDPVGRMGEVYNIELFE